MDKGCLNYGWYPLVLHEVEYHSRAVAAKEGNRLD